MVWNVDWQVFINGGDVSQSMRPYLTSLSASDKEGTQSDTCDLTFSDTDGQLRLPDRGALLGLSLQGVSVFNGTISGVTSSGNRSGGRVLKVSAKGFDDRGKVKEPQQFHMDDASLQAFLGEAAKRAGLSGISVDADLASITRDYWAADNESFLHLGQRLAREMYATFKIRQDKAVFVPRGKDLGLPPVLGNANGGNVISWTISPATGRNDFTEIEVRYLDRETGRIEMESVSLGNDRDLPASVNRIRTIAKDRDQAKQVAQSRKNEADDQAGSGSVVIDIAPHAQAEALFLLTGARAGVDGIYRIAGRTHTASRSSGARTSLQLKQPKEGAGKDDR